MVGDGRPADCPVLLCAFTLLWRVPNTFALLAAGFFLQSSGGLLQTELVFERLILPVEFIGLALLLTGAGLALLTIGINLRLSGRLLRIQYTLRYLAAEAITAPAFQTAFHAERQLEHFILPWKLPGIGLILFAIGRLFGVIVESVKAWQEAIGEVVSNLCYLVADSPGLEAIGIREGGDLTAEPGGEG